MSRTRALTMRSRATVVIAKITTAARAVVVGVALSSLGACYTYSAVPTTQPVAEERVELRLSDEGRVAMQRELGPGVLTVEGRIVQVSESGWRLAVYRMTNVEGHASTWTGEEIQVPRNAVAVVSTRKLDRQASMVAAAGVTGAIIAFIASRSLFGGGTQIDPGGGPVDPSIRR